MLQFPLVAQLEKLYPLAVATAYTCLADGARKPLELPVAVPAEGLEEETARLARALFVMAKNAVTAQLPDFTVMVVFCAYAL